MMANRSLAAVTFPEGSLAKLLAPGELHMACPWIFLGDPSGNQELPVARQERQVLLGGLLLHATEEAVGFYGFAEDYSM